MGMRGRSDKPCIKILLISEFYGLFTLSRMYYASAVLGLMASTLSVVVYLMIVYNLLGRRSRLLGVF